MAGLKKAIEIIFQGSDVSLSRTIRGIEKDIGSVDSAFGGLGGHAASLTRDVALLGTAVGGMAIAFGAFAANEAIEFESAQLDLQKVLSDSEGSVDQYTDKINELALHYGVSSSAVTQSAANFKQAGFDINESLLLVKSGLDLTIAGEIEAGQASEYLISILNGFKAPATDAARVTDILNEVSNNFATNVEELAIGMGKISPIANKMNLSYEETVGILTPVIEVFRSGSEASRALRTGLLKLIDDSKPVKDALAALGVSQLDVNGHLRSGKDILLDVSSAFQSVNENDKLFLATQLTGTDQAAKMIEVFDGLANSTKITSAAMNAQGSALKEVDIRLGSTEKMIDKLKVGFELFLQTVGGPIIDELKPIFEDLLKTLKDVETQILAGEIGQAFANWISLLAEFGRSVDLIYRDITGIQNASILVDFTKWAGDTETVKSALTAVNSVVQGILLPVAAIHDGFVTTGEFIAVGMTAAILGVNEAALVLIKLLDKIPGINLSGPIKDLEADLKISQGAWEEAKDSLYSIDEEKLWTNKMVESIDKVDGAIQSIGTTSEAAAKKTDDAFKEIGTDSTEGITKAIVAVGDASIETADKTEVLSDALKSQGTVYEENQTSLDTQVKKLADFQIEMEKIASTERLGVLEIKAEIQTAQIQADIEKVETMFGSLNNTVTTTGATIESLYSTLGQVQDWGIQQDIERSIERQEQIQREAHEKALESIDKQMELIDAQIAALSDDDIVITFSMEDVSPAVEAIMYEVADKMKLTANAQGAEYLLLSGLL